MNTTEAPFQAKWQLSADFDGHGPPPHYMPGYPRVPLHDRPAMLRFLESEYCSTDLDCMAGKLWWMSKQDHTNMSPLHRQRVKGRNIVVTEDPRLHLVWIQDRMFVKPLPRYLSSSAFWQKHMGLRDASEASRARTLHIRKAALGFLRTYYFLVKTEYDFRIAQDPNLQLLPADITWEQFCFFSTSFVDIKDRDVSGRYAYGELRLTRLNFYAPLLLGKGTFQRVEYQSTTYFARFYGPILFLIGMTSIILNGFQIIVGVEQAKPTEHSDASFDVALWYSILVVVFFCLLFVGLVTLYVYRQVKEWNFAIRDRMRLLEEGKSKTEVC